MLEKLTNGRARFTIPIIEVNTGVLEYKPRSSICNLKRDGSIVIDPRFEWHLPTSHFIDENVIAVPSAVRACIIRLVDMNKLYKEERNTANRYYRKMLVKAGVPLWKRCLHLTGIEPHIYIAAVFRKLSSTWF